MTTVRGKASTKGGGGKQRMLYSLLPKIFQHERGKRKSIFSDNDYSKKINMEGEIFNAFSNVEVSISG